MLDGLESRLQFISIDIELAGVHGLHEIIKENDAFLIVYSISDKASFVIAAEILKLMRTSGANKTQPCILVGNKSDLVRKRSVSPSEGRALAFKYSSKFVETSVAINDKVDDLLAGTLKQIRLREAQDRDVLRLAHNAKNTMKKTHSRNFSDANLHDLVKKSASSGNPNAFSLKTNTLTKKLFRMNKKENDLLDSSSISSSKKNDRVYLNTKVGVDGVVAGTASNNGNYTFFHKLFNTLFKKRAMHANLNSVENLFTLPITFTNKVKKII
jgi:GTPase SAR1 family protein